MPAALEGTPIVFGHEFRKQVGGKGFLIATLTIPVLLVLIWIAIPLIRGLTDDGGDAAAGSAAGTTGTGSEQTASIKPIGVVMQTTDVAVDFSQFPAFRVYADNAAGVDDLKSGEIDEFFVICRTISPPARLSTTSPTTTVRGGSNSGSS